MIDLIELTNMFRINVSRLDGCELIKTKLVPDYRELNNSEESKMSIWLVFLRAGLQYLATYNKNFMAKVAYLLDQ